MRLLGLIFFLACVESFQSLCILGENVQNEQECNPSNYPAISEILKTFFKKYYEKQRAVKVFQINDNCCDWLSIGGLIEEQNVIMYDFGKVHESQEDTIYRPNYGYLTITQEINKDFLSILDQLSTNGPWIVILNENRNEFDKDLLKVAWNEYRMLHLVILLYNYQCKLHSLWFYNPFTDVQYSEVLIDDDSIQRIMHIIDGRARNLNGFKLRVYLNDYVETYASPMVDARGNVLKFKGIDGEVLEGIRHAMNFNVDFVSLPNEMTFSEQENILNQLVLTRNIDVFAESRSISKSQVTNVYSLTSIAPTFVVCAVRTIRVKHIIHGIFGFLDTTGNIVFGVVLILLSSCLFLITRTLKNSYNSECFWRSPLDVIGVMLGVSRSLLKYTQISSRLIFVSIFILYLSITSIYQASIVRDLNVHVKISQVNTIANLIQKNYSILAFHEFSNIIKGFGKYSTIYNKLNQKLIYNDDLSNRQIFDKLSDGSFQHDIGTLIFEYQALYLQAQYLDKQSNLNPIHLVNEPIFSIRTSIHLPKFSPFVPIMDEMLYRVLETGIRQKGFNDAKILINTQKIRRVKRMKAEGVLDVQRPKPITLENMSVTFLIYLELIVVALVTFIAEIIYYKVTCFCSSNVRNVYIKKI